MPSESSRDPLPFEPRQTKKKTPKTEPVVSQKAEVATGSADRRRTAKEEASLSAIPDVVSKRMLRRMIWFSGVPTAMGIGSFAIAYYIVVKDLFDLPTIAVLLVSLGFFGLGVVGLSYGILSTAWDEERVGSVLGWEEFTLNFGRMVAAWKEGRQQIRSKS